MRNPRLRILLSALNYTVFATCTLAATVQVALKSPGARTDAPSFRLMDVSGRAEQLADYRGKVVLLNFWATDCGGCRLEIPWLVDIANAFRNKSVAVIGVSMDISYADLKNATEAWAKVKPFIALHKITYPILMQDNDGMKQYDVRALPASYLIDTRGRVAGAYVGLVDKENVKDNINALLAENSAWRYEKDDPVTKKKIAEIEAASFQEIADGRAKLLHEVTARVYDNAGSYRQITTQEAIVDQGSGILIYGPHLTATVRLATQK